MTVWLDKQTFLPLKWEVRDGSGAISERSEVTSVEFNVSIPPSTFEFTPPAGVPVYEFSGGSGADAKRMIFEGGGQSGAAPNPKKP
jgi:hypothetical protein